MYIESFTRKYLWDCLFFEFPQAKYLAKVQQTQTKAKLLLEGISFLIHLFARAISLLKKLKIEETKAT